MLQIFSTVQLSLFLTLFNNEFGFFVSVFLSVYPSDVKYNPIVIIFMDIIQYHYIMFGIAKKVYAIYGSFTEILRRIPLRGGVWRKIF